MEGPQFVSMLQITLQLPLLKQCGTYWWYHLRWADDEFLTQLGRIASEGGNQKKFPHQHETMHLPAIWVPMWLYFLFILGGKNVKHSSHKTWSVKWREITVFCGYFLNSFLLQTAKPKFKCMFFLNCVLNVGYPIWRRGGRWVVWRLFTSQTGGSSSTTCHTLGASSARMTEDFFNSIVSVSSTVQTKQKSILMITHLPKHL